MEDSGDRAGRVHMNSGVDTMLPTSDTSGVDYPSCRSWAVGIRQQKERPT